MLRIEPLGALRAILTIIGDFLSCYKLIVLKVFLMRVETDSISCGVPSLVETLSEELGNKIDAYAISYGFAG